jgi:hypothetical protein
MYQEGIRMALSARNFERRTTHGQAHAGQRPAPHIRLPFAPAASRPVESLAASLAAAALNQVCHIRTEIQRTEGHRHHRQNRNHHAPPGRTASDVQTVMRCARDENVTAVMLLMTEVTWRSALIRARGPGLFFSSTCLGAPALRKLPLTKQLLSAGAHGKTEQLGEVGGTVNIEPDSGKVGVVEHD